MAEVARVGRRDPPFLPGAVVAAPAMPMRTRRQRYLRQALPTPSARAGSPRGRGVAEQ